MDRFSGNVIRHPVQVVPEFVPGFAKFVLFQPEYPEVVFKVKSTVDVDSVGLEINVYKGHSNLAQRSALRDGVFGYGVNAVEDRLDPGCFDIFGVADLIPADFFLEDVLNMHQLGERDDVIILKEAAVLRKRVGLFVDQELVA